MGMNFFFVLGPPLHLLREINESWGDMCCAGWWTVWMLRMNLTEPVCHTHLLSCKDAIYTFNPFSKRTHLEKLLLLLTFVYWSSLWIFISVAIVCADSHSSGLIPCCDPADKYHKMLCYFWAKNAWDNIKRDELYAQTWDCNMLKSLECGD